MPRMKKVKEILGRIEAYGYEDPDADGEGNYYLKIVMRKTPTPDKGTDKALYELLRRRVQVIQVGE